MGRPKCSKCSNSKSKHPKLSFHAFPKPGEPIGKVRAQIWAEWCYPDESWEDPEKLEKLFRQHRYVCSEHFTDAHFVDSTRKHLHRNAVPIGASKRHLLVPQIYRKRLKSYKGYSFIEESTEAPTCDSTNDTTFLWSEYKNYTKIKPEEKLELIDNTAVWFLDENIPEETKADGAEVIFANNAVYPDIANHPILLQLLIKPKDESGGIFHDDVFLRKIKPIIVKLFESTEARVRLKLLDCFSDYVQTFTEEETRLVLLPEILKGMQDVDKSIVRATLICLAHLVDILGPQVVVGGTRRQSFVFNIVVPRDEIVESAQIKIESNDDSANETDCDSDAEKSVNKKTKTRKLAESEEVAQSETEKKISKGKHRRKNLTDNDESEVNDSVTERNLPIREFKGKNIQATEDSDDDTDSANESENDELVECDIEIDNNENNKIASDIIEELCSSQAKEGIISGEFEFIKEYLS